MAKAEKTKTVLPAMGQIVRIRNTSGRDGYRRGGQAHPKGAKDWPNNAFDADQLEALQADDNIDVSVVDAPKGEAAKE